MGAVAGIEPLEGEGLELRMVRQVMGLVDVEPVEQIRYSLSGKLNRSAYGSLRFKSEGEFKLAGRESSQNSEP